MKYIATVTHGNNRHDTTVDAQDARTAHTIARQANPNADKIQVKPDTSDTIGLMVGALMVARITASNAILRTGGNATQVTIDRDLRIAQARLSGVTSAVRVVDVISGAGQDAQDFYSICQLALLNAQASGLDMAAQYDSAYKTLNTAVHAMQTAHAYEVRTEWLTDNGGNLVALNDAIACIIRGGDKWTPCAGGDLSEADAIALGDAIRDALQPLNRTLRNIARLLAIGYSQRQIATRMGTSVATVSRNVARLRKAMSDHIRMHVPQFADLLPADPIDNATRTTNVTGGRKDAAYYRAYRAARKAAKQANN